MGDMADYINFTGREEDDGWYDEDDDVTNRKQLGWERYTRKESTYYEKALKQLQEYENERESGLLLKIPCKVGDTVYGIANTACKGDNATIMEEKQEICYTCMTMNCDCNNCKYGVPEINKFVCAYIILSEKNYYVVDERFRNYRFENVFYSKEKAEERLKLLQGRK